MLIKCMMTFGLIWCISCSVLQKCQTIWTKSIDWSVWCSTCLLQTTTRYSSCAATSNGENNPRLVFIPLMCLFFCFFFKSVPVFIACNGSSALNWVEFIMLGISSRHLGTNEWTRCPGRKGKYLPFLLKPDHKRGHFPRRSPKFLSGILWPQLSKYASAEPGSHCC